MEKAYLSTLVFIGLAMSGIAGDLDLNYGDVSKDVSDISFYTPAANADAFPMPDRPAPPALKNVILLIGDGMGFGQVAMAREKAAGAGGRLYMEKMPVKGDATTYSESAITDSAAAGTALACGVKTKNGVIGMNADGIACRSILEAAKAQGRKTALVATSTISHATPASFASHVGSRGQEPDISAQILANKVNVLLGSGRQFWIPKTVKGSKRNDDRNLLEDAQHMGYLLASDSESLSKASGDFVLGLFQMGQLTTFPPEPNLPQMTQAAIRILTEKPGREGQGFFMMVEGSQIDWAGHANNTENSIKQTLLLDQAVKTALDFAVADGNTLVIVTADHETGGLTRHDDSFKWTIKGHTATAVPVYAFGPGAGLFSGSMDNTDIPKKIASLMGINDFPKMME